MKAWRKYGLAGLFLLTLAFVAGGGFECETDDDDIFDKVINPG